MQPERLSKAVEAAHASVVDRWDVSLDDFHQFIKDWEVFPVEIQGETVGAILRKDAEIHACIKLQGFGRWFNKFAKQILESTIEKHGFATTTVTQGNQIGDAFVRRLGFQPCGEVAGNWKYRKVKNGT